MKKQPNQPIVLSGRVFFDGFLAEVTEAGRTAGASRPAVLLPGDIKLHNVNKGGTRPRFGQDVSFDGFISAGVYDGKRFRRLLLRQHAAVDASYQGAIARRDKAHACRRHLLNLGGKCAVWVDKDSGYTVTYKDNSSRPAAVKPAPVAASPAAEKPTTPAAVSAAVDLSPAPVAVATSTTTAADKPVATPAVHKPVKRRTRRRKVNPNQLDMFGGK
ncbi:MAG: hypothetical protein KA794_13755 [Candidatus Obscuribacter sp.]|jgi:hypothetical protein|nr:hypothetical protein [Candidatus Obscuribacter sp.]